MRGWRIWYTPLRDFSGCRMEAISDISDSGGTCFLKYRVTCSSGCPKTYVAKDDFEPLNLLPHLPSPGVTGMYHHTFCFCLNLCLVFEI